MDDWKNTDYRYVAYIDIMGFKNLVLRSTHSQVYSLMKKIKKTMEENEAMPWAGIIQKQVRSTSYSDSIILYSKNASFDSLRSIIASVSSLTNDLFELGIPHKGGIAFGKMTLDTENSIFFGQPLIDAFLLQEEVNFYGVVLHGTAQKEISIVNRETLLLKNYLCPLKEGSSFHLVIVPIFLEEVESEDKLDKRYRKKLYDSLEKFRNHTSGHLRKYIDNTETFFKFINNS